jgi:hypothetical protein
LRLARAFEAIAIPKPLTLVREHATRLTKTLAAPYEHSAAVYEFFLNCETDNELRRLALARLANCLWKAGTQRLLAGEYGYAATLFWRSLVSGGAWRGKD